MGWTGGQSCKSSGSTWRWKYCTFIQCFAAIGMPSRHGHARLRAAPQTGKLGQTGSDCRWRLYSPRYSSPTLHPTSGGHVALYSLLDQLAIPYQRIDHAPVFTCEEASRLLPKLPAAKTKNLFLRDPKSERLFLVVTPEESRVDLKALAAALGVKRLSFGSPERLEAVLGLTPGSVTLLAMVRDREKAVELVMDETIWQAERVQCHPLVNTATLLIRLDDVRRLLAHLGREATVMRLPVVSD
ncbi:hypothetical protein GPK29_23690 [Aeromonas hydrophila]|nr:hypothetical protein [Aeromonas hydrophila]MBW3803979.1 hypothetical protein [Aeromonas hydrophila]MBW3821322.1 hypothetical protein [Aeromonas hydrophila]